MTPEIIKLSDVREQEYLRALRFGGVGLAALAVGGALFYFSNFSRPVADTAFNQPQTGAIIARIVAGLIMLCGVAMIGAAGYGSLQMRNLPSFPFFCPYCNGKNLFIKPPHADFDCDHCNRTVHFVEGEAVPIRDIECLNCHAQHRVPVTLTRYVCDQCNALMEWNPETLPQAPPKQIA